MMLSIPSLKKQIPSRNQPNHMKNNTQAHSIINPPFAGTIFTIMALVTLLPCMSSFAEIGPGTGKAWQKAAPEKLEVLVESAKSEPRENDGAKLKVVRVMSTITGLKAGDVIDVRYTRPNFEKSPQAGSWADDVEKGKSYKAWLMGAKKTGYSPSAASFSFEPIKKEK